jgi:hypothetical protein
MAWTSADISWKRLLSKRQTSSTKAFYEEWGDYTINMYSEEIWFDHVPSDASSLTGVIQWYNRATLINDPTVPSNLGWTLVTNPSNAFSFSTADDPTNLRLKDWISDKYGAGYEITLYANGSIVPKTSDTTPWVFNYVTGELAFNTTAPTTPIQITGYRYIGKKGLAGIFLKEASLGSGFRWDASGFLDVSVGTGASSFATLTDGSIVNPSTNDTLKWDASWGKWMNKPDFWDITDSTVFLHNPCDNLGLSYIELQENGGALLFSDMPSSSTIAGSEQSYAMQIDGSNALRIYGISASTCLSETAVIVDANYLAFGDPLTNGSWRLKIDASGFNVEKRVSGSWVVKGNFN